MKRAKLFRVTQMSFSICCMFDSLGQNNQYSVFLQLLKKELCGQLRLCLASEIFFFFLLSAINLVSSKGWFMCSVHLLVNKYPNSTKKLIIHISSEMRWFRCGVLWESFRICIYVWWGGAGSITLERWQIEKMISNQNTWHFPDKSDKNSVVDFQIE